MAENDKPNIYQEEIVQILQEQYGIKALEITHNITATSPFCAKIKCTRQGYKGEKTVICKLLLPDGVKFLDCSVYGPQMQVITMEHLLKNGLQCSKPVPTLGGSMYCDIVPKALQGERIIMVLEYIPGKSLNIDGVSLQELQDSGEWMAYIQLALKTLKEGVWSPEYIFQNENGDIFLDRLHLLDTEERKQYARQFLVRWRDWWSEAVYRCELSAVHGDLHIANIIAIEGKSESGIKERYGLVDFEYMRYGLDLWSFAFGMACNAIAFNAKGFIYEDVYKSLLTGYNRVVKLTDQDLEDLYNINCFGNFLVVMYACKQKKLYPEMIKKYLGMDGNALVDNYWNAFESFCEKDSKEVVEGWRKALGPYMCLNP